MLRLYFILLLFISTASITGCGKNGSPNEEFLLYGKWANTTTNNDTLYFYKQGGKNIMSSRISLSPSVPNTKENEYRLNNGKLFIGYTNAGLTEFFEYDTFRWKQRGKQFELNGNQRFPILSSIQPMYTYEKMQ